MSEGTIDNLTIQVSSNAQTAAKGFEKLAASLGTLEKRLGPTASKLWTLASNLQMVGSSLKGLNASSLTALGSAKLSSTLPKNLEALANAVQKFPKDSLVRLGGLSAALAPLNGFKFNRSAVDNLAQLPKVLKGFEGLDTLHLTQELAQLNTQLGPLGASVKRLSEAYSSMPKSMRSAALAAKSVSAANHNLARSAEEVAVSQKTLAGSVKNVGAAFLDSVRKISLFSGALYSLKRVFNATIGEVNTYIENMNLFEVAMGGYTESAMEFANTVQGSLGIDAGEWARNQGIFQTLITGMGMTADKASVMSQQLTQLGYDLTSMYNLTGGVEEGMLKVQSAIAGELEPLRRLGYDLSNARLQLEATNMGISKSVQQMTQAEKVALRYHTIMTQVTQSHGDMARTIDSPANQLRVLQAQLKLTARAIGAIFIPALNMTLPVLITVAKAVRILAERIAELAGITAGFKVDYSDVDYSGIATGADEFNDLSDAAEKAKQKVKEYKNTVMGFDELHKLNSETESKGKDKDLDTGSFDIPLETYDFLEGLKSNIAQMTDEMAQRLVDMLPYIGAVAAGLLAWKLADSFLPDTLTGASRIKKILGLVLSVLGAIQLAHGAWSAWMDGLNGQNMIEMLTGAAALVAGLALAFGHVAAGIGAIVSGIVIFGVSLKDALENGISEMNLFGMAAGTGLAVLGSIIAGLSPMITGLIGVIGGGAIAVVSFMDAWNNGVGLQNIEGYIGGAAIAIAGLYTAFGPLGAVIGGVIAGIGALVMGLHDMWANGFSPENFAMTELGFTGIGVAIGSLFGPVGALIGGIIGAVAGLIATLIVDFDGFSAWLLELWDGIVEGTRFAWEPVARFFTDLWSNVVNIFGFAAESLRFAIEVIVNVITLPWQFLWVNFGTPVQNAWNAVSTTIANAVQAIQANLSAKWASIKSVVSSAVSAIGSAVRTAWNTVQSVTSTVFNAVSGAVQSRMQAVQSAVGTVVGKVQNVVGSGFNAAYNTVSNIFNNIYTTISNVMSNAANTVSGMIERIKSFFNFSWSLPQLKLPHISISGHFSINWYKQGGFPDVGELFVARESGPELVGSMGNKSAVANNQQIVDGIEAGVMRGVVQAMAMSGGNRQQGGQSEIVMTIDGREVMRGLIPYLDDMVRTGEYEPSFSF